MLESLMIVVGVVFVLWFAFEIGREWQQKHPK